MSDLITATGLQLKQLEQVEARMRLGVDGIDTWIASDEQTSAYLEIYYPSVNQTVYFDMDAEGVKTLIEQGQRALEHLGEGT